MRDQFKDVDIKGQRYQIGRFSAKVGSWILTVVGNLSDMDEDKFGKVQDHALKVCKKYEPNGATALPVIDAMGRWPDAALEYDTVTVMALTMQALRFNLEDFFGGNGLQEIMQGLPDFSPSPTQA